METLLNPQAEALIAYRTFWQAGEEGWGKALGERGSYGSGLGMGGGYWERTGICRDCMESTDKFRVDFCELLMVLSCVKEIQETEDT